jgi:hypothetical protein
MAAKNQVVMPYRGLWAVQGEGNARVTSIHATRQEAIGAATQIAVQQHSNVLVHDDGVLKARWNSETTSEQPPVAGQSERRLR